MADRDQSINNIENLYGCPGANYSTDNGERLLIELFEEHGGLSLLSDEAVAKLAELHLREDARTASRYERRA
ncbi:hypothetical protein [Bradyrhizobium sp. WSM1253]|uniref:hypothetical protein n=1 Tax=Bradyrhizobium sp. WSM1253 TaxID=319003 RepID=UPI00025D2E3E|nr:hypothetical protein [Bradyrhizobium sp. WSM1253]EIG62919.1 hypothetical protein Bra1253DRAFT_07864 [Bradyrhizobium sp. WSM1253]